jgi:alanine racemase
VSIAGRRAAVLGRISMDVTVVDITDITGIEPGAVATLIGLDPDGGDAISLEEVAGRCGTISYELLTGFTPRLPRVWVPEVSADRAPERPDVRVQESQSPKTS